MHENWPRKRGKIGYDTCNPKKLFVYIIKVALSNNDEKSSVSKIYAFLFKEKGIYLIKYKVKYDDISIVQVTNPTFSCWNDWPIKRKIIHNLNFVCKIRLCVIL